MPKHFHTHCFCITVAERAEVLDGKRLPVSPEMSGKLGVTSAEPRRNTKRGTNFPYTSNALFCVAKAVGDNLSDENDN